MVHGGCESVGCYAMTDYEMEEIYGLADEAFKGGQTKIQLEAFPFQMTAENLARHADDPRGTVVNLIAQQYADRCHRLAFTRCHENKFS